LLHSEDDYSFTILGDSFRFNKEAGELKKDFQSRSEEGLRVLPNADEANDTTKTFLSPDEVVRRTLENQQNKNWKRFIDGFDLAALLVNSYSGSDIYERYLGARADEKLVILDEFKNFLIQSLPYTLDRFDVAETKMSGNDARVNVGTVFKQASKKYVSQMNPETGKIEFKWVDLNYQDLVQEASMNYDLEKKNGVWRIIRMDVTLKKVVAPVIKRTPKYDKPKPIVLPDIRFMRGRAELLPSSDPTLDRLLSEMIRDPSLTIELYGHTDNVGDRSMNMILSLARADAVKSFLTDHGIKATRIKTQGFGPDKPIASNDEEEGRLKNRRVEFLPIKP
jgi:outer membrane protein OmpA-like peptidoglycan-associated protein